MTSLLALVVIFSGLLVLEWRYKHPLIRVGTALLAAGIVVLMQGSARQAARNVYMAPPSERVTELHGSLITDYQSGVLTMEDAVVEGRRIFRNERRVALAVLLWLACTPALRRREASSRRRTADRRETVREG